MMRETVRADRAEPQVWKTVRCVVDDKQYLLEKIEEYFAEKRRELTRPRRESGSRRATAGWTMPRPKRGGKFTRTSIYGKRLGWERSRASSACSLYTMLTDRSIHTSGKRANAHTP